MHLNKIKKHSSTSVTLRGGLEADEWHSLLLKVNQYQICASSSSSSKKKKKTTPELVFLKRALSTALL